MCELRHRKPVRHEVLRGLASYRQLTDDNNLARFLDDQLRTILRSDETELGFVFDPARPVRNAGENLRAHVTDLPAGIFQRSWNVHRCRVGSQLA